MYFWALNIIINKKFKNIKSIFILDILQVLKLK